MPDRVRAKLCFYTLATALVFSAQAAGAIHLPTVAAYATLILVSGALLALPRSTSSRLGRMTLGGPKPLEVEGSAIEAEPPPAARPTSRIDVAAGVCFALALYSLLQALPIPVRWLAMIAPDQADIWARSLTPFGLPAPSFASISLAPRRTVVEALEVASYGVVLAVSARSSRKSAGRIVALGFATALCVAVVTAVHRVLGAELLFGVYEPQDQYPVVAPLLSPNSRAGYLNLGFFCGLGLLFRAGPNPRGILLGVGLVFLAAEILLCQSRGGTGALFVGLLLVLILQRVHRAAPVQSQRGRRWQALVMGLIALTAVLMALSVRLRGGFGFEDSLSKLDVLARAGRLALDHVAFGVGRGAFGSAFSHYQSGSGVTVFEHAENLLLQWAAEWGVPVTLAASGALAWSVLPALSRSSLRDPMRSCAAVGVCVLLGQNLVDLGLEIPAVAALLASVLGALVGVTQAPGPAMTRLSTSVLRWGSIVTAVCLGLAIAFGAESPARQRRSLHAALLETKAVPNAAFWKQLLGAVRAYPADPYFPLLGASAALAEKRDAIPWVARALERAPSSATAHVMLGRALLARGATGQAIGALRRAAELDPERAFAAIGVGLEGKLEPALLEPVIPAGVAGAPLLRMLADASKTRQQRLHWLEAALARDPASADLHYALALELYRDIAQGERGVVCGQTRSECLQRALEHAERAAQPASSKSAILKSQLLEISEGPQAAEDQLASACDLFPGDEACVRQLVQLALRSGSSRLPTAVRALVAAGCVSPERCARAHLDLGRMYAGAGQWHLAASHFRQATVEAPSAESWRAFADASRQLGQEARADDALRKAELLEPAKKGVQ